MLESLTITAQVGQYVKYTASFKGKKLTSESTPTPNYADETLFRARDLVVKIADTEGGLAGANPIDCTRVNLTVEKNHLHTPSNRRG